MSNQMNPYFGSNPPKGPGRGPGGPGGRQGPPGPNPWAQQQGPPHGGDDPRTREMDRRGPPGRIAPGPMSPNMRPHEQRIPPGGYPGGGDFNRGPPRDPRGGFGGPPQQSKGDIPGPNDCEIITINDPDMNYVNIVENAVKDMNLKADVMIPKVTVKISTLIENLANRGTIFAIIIRPENVEHRSVSVHVLRGPPKPEEHRNMPLMSAYALIQKSISDLKKKEIGLYPENIKSLLKLMLEDRSLTDNEYAIIINFLQERRRRQASYDTRGDREQAIMTQEELQQRILKIINGEQTTPLESGPGVLVDHDHQNPRQNTVNVMNQNIMQGGGPPPARPFNM